MISLVFVAIFEVLVAILLVLVLTVFCKVDKSDYKFPTFVYKLLILPEFVAIFNVLAAMFEVLVAISILA